MMLDGATIQVPFLADLVTMADPTSRVLVPQLPQGRPAGSTRSTSARASTRCAREYDDYCRWAADAARPRPVRATGSTAVEHDGDGLRRHAPRPARPCRGAPLVLGIGTAAVRAAARRRDRRRRPSTAPTTCTDKDAAPGRRARSPSSAAGRARPRSTATCWPSIDARGYELNWVTRSPRFFPMEYTKLTLEMTSPEYTAYFHALPGRHPRPAGARAAPLYKGISGDLVDEIFDTLYQQEVTGDGPTDAAHRHRGDRRALGRRRVRPRPAPRRAADDRHG